MSELTQATRRINPLPDGMVLACHECEDLFPYQYIRSCPECGSAKTSGAIPDSHPPWKITHSNKPLSWRGRL